MTDDLLYNELLDALYATFGNHAGYRVTHAKGILASGIFTPSKKAREVSRASHLQGPTVPVILRFSNFSGIPTIADGDATASPRGLSIRFRLPSSDSSTDVVAHSFDGFPVSTPQQFLGFLRGIAASVNQPYNPTLLNDFLAGHPIARRYMETPKLTPSSYLLERYFGVNTFRFINAGGSTVFGRYRVDSTIEGAHLSDQEASAYPADFLMKELANRLRVGPSDLKLQLQLPSPVDDLADSAVAWPHSGPDARREVELGLITVQKILSLQDGEAEAELGFNPGNLIDGIDASADPMIMVRKRIYELGVIRRQRVLQ